LKEGIFVGLDIRKLLSDDLFETTMKGRLGMLLRRP
jgi:hypothetical protein